jgi:signal transduction histidine kinase
MKPRPDRQLNALVEAGMVLASELDLEALLQRIADLSREVVGASYGAVGVVGAAGELARFVYSGIDDETAKLIGDLPSGRGVLGALLEQDRPLRLSEISEHPRSYGFPQHHPPMPIIVRGNVFGRLYLTEKAGGKEFTKDDERIATTLAGQAGVAIENARLYDEVQTLTEALKDMAVLEERERIAKELHDGVIQSIYSVGLSLQGSTSMMSRDPALSARRIEQAISELDNVVRDVRSYIFELRPHVVEEKGLQEAIAELARDLEVNALADTEVDIAALTGLSERQERNLIQVVREALSNIARHARATHVKVGAVKDENVLTLTIEDDGTGFDVDEVVRGNGLNNMQRRVMDLGGSLSMKRRAPKGMCMTVTIPWEGELGSA